MYLQIFNLTQVQKKKMKSSNLHIILLFLHILLFFPTPTISQLEFTKYICDGDRDGNYTTNSKFSKNLHTLLSSITSNTHNNYGYYNLSVGQKLDIVNGVALCRADISTPDCKTCIHHATTEITSVCPNQRMAARSAERR